ncbi:MULTISPECIES: nicotinamide-nucleotide amidase [Vibrio]|uniref:Nicotinamide-nucleotide amidohydrolase PncC n=2 Tax=Vibrio TaxID=662 RepID=A0A240EB14_9VIBR|nr:MULTISPECIES: nicotinamide-nucleotide amidase [Vibrio]ASI89790.1 damage-inducible protein CinA [Vibrio mediterranei]EDL52576.1 CinA-related protein [Vibrio mediterranei AK1]KFA96157.1 damage-inducible protein CinA [Vibrio sp. ER1A]MCF4176014.1 nicotinamide-nucleotide amidase [Vibrio sp. McD22-P3]MCG9624443.1 nicotinamide-nucleotide amidase [Vibrio mediterranei]
MNTIEELSFNLGALLEQKDHILVTAESCTGGGVATAITDIAGSSAWFDRAFVTYSNDAKIDMLGVATETLGQNGAVSEAVVVEMAQGALQHSKGTLSVAISGIAGPGGGSEDKPVGTVCFAWASQQGWLKVETCLFEGDRAAVRQQAVMHALLILYRHVLEDEPYC